MSSLRLAACLQLLRSQNALARRFEAPLGDLHGLSLHELLLLLYLKREPSRRLRRVDLAERLVMSQSSMTRMLGPLERRGIVERDRDARDARVTRARLTPAGEELVSEATETAERVADEIFEPWPQTDVKTLADWLRRLTAGLPGAL